MSIGKDEKFMQLLEELMACFCEEQTTSEFIDSINKYAETLNEFIDYIDEYINLQCNIVPDDLTAISDLTEAVVKEYSLLNAEALKDIQKELNQRVNQRILASIKVKNDQERDPS